MKTKVYVLLILTCHFKVYSQSYQKFIAGNTENLPNVQLYLESDSTFDLKLFANSCWDWQFYHGEYSVHDDTLSLRIPLFYEEPTCQIIDSSKKNRILGIRDISDSNAFQNIRNDTTEFDEYTIWHFSTGSLDTFNISLFPLEYKDTSKLRDPAITHIYRVNPNPTDKLILYFYRPKKKVRKVIKIDLPMVDDVITIPLEWKDLFLDFEKLKNTNR